jgi:hypothetical protein
MNSGGFGTGCSKAQSLDETKLIRPDGVFSRAACRTFFPHIGLAEARRYGEGGWATNLGRCTCITGVRLITETIGGGIACQIHMLAKTRFHLTSHLLFTVPSKRDKVPVWGKSCSQIEVCWILKMMAQAQPHRQSLGPGEFCRVFELGQRHIITGTAASLDIVMNTHGEICDLTACNPCIA